MVRRRFDAESTTLVERRRILTMQCGVLLMFILGCSQQIYTFGGPGHGTDFIVPNGAAMNPDPIVQSWAAYSLSRGTCQMLRSDEAPSRFSSFECELRSREVLVERWSTRGSTNDEASRVSDPYLDLLIEVERAGFLGEYVWHYFREGGWIKPDFLRMPEFEKWRSSNLAWHRPKTRIIGYWSTPEPAR